MRVAFVCRLSGAQCDFPVRLRARLRLYIDKMASRGTVGGHFGLRGCSGRSLRASSTAVCLLAALS